MKNLGFMDLVDFPPRILGGAFIICFAQQVHPLVCMQYAHTKVEISMIQHTKFYQVFFIESVTVSYQIMLSDQFLPQTSTRISPQRGIKRGSHKCHWSAMCTHWVSQFTCRYTGKWPLSKIGMKRVTRKMVCFYIE